MTAVRRGRTVIGAGGQVDPLLPFLLMVAFSDRPESAVMIARGENQQEAAKWRLNRGRNPPIGHGPRLSARLFFSFMAPFRSPGSTIRGAAGRGEALDGPPSFRGLNCLRHSSFLVL